MFMISQILRVILIGAIFICIHSFSNITIAQAFTVITNADDCEVFVDGLSVGKGKKVVVDHKFVKYLIQIKVTRPEYKPEFNVIYKGEKEIKSYFIYFPIAALGPPVAKTASILVFCPALNIYMQASSV